MSHLTCPVCKVGMREVEREGVTIDVCTQCRGVWLDRGELEKLSEALSRGGGAGTSVRASVVDEPRRDDRRSFSRSDERRSDADRERFRRDQDDDEEDDRYGRGERHRKSGVARFLDFFD